MSHNPHTILVVDPDERSYKTFESVLGSKNNVWFVPNGKTAIGLPDSQSIDIIFVSHMLNGVSGMELLEIFKKKFPSIPVVLLADQPKVDEVISAFRLGARELIIKPIDKKELTRVANKIFGFIADRSKRSWFFGEKERIQKDRVKKNYKKYLTKLFKRTGQKNNLHENELEKLHGKDKECLTVDFCNHLIGNASIDPDQSDKMKHPSEPITDSYPLIRAFFFGTFRVFVNNTLIEKWPSKKGKSIFAYLLLNHRKKIFRDVLMDIFWKKSCPDSARNCLNVYMHRLRRVLEEIDPNNEYILFKDECYYLNPLIKIKLDIEEFRKAWRNAQSIEHEKNLSAAVSEYQQAAEIYNGEFLEEEIYEDWSSLDRENLKEIFLVILDKISENFMHTAKYNEAIIVCEGILKKDNCREDIYRRLMTCYAYLGQRSKALKLYHKCSKMLKAELEAEPTSITVELFKKIKTDRIGCT